MLEDKGWEDPRSVNSPRRILSFSKNRKATVFFPDPDDRDSGFGVSGDQGPKTSEVYGFVGSITTVVATVLFLVWAYLPEHWLHSLGIVYYPSRYWALAAPGSKGLSESTPEISTCETDISFARYTPSMSGRQLFLDMQLEQRLGSGSVRLHDRVDSIDFSNFLDVEWLSSSGNSCEEEAFERSAIIGSPCCVLPSDCVTVESKAETSSSVIESSSVKRQEQTSKDINFDAKGSSKHIAEFSEKFVHWVNNGDMLFP